MRVAQLLALMVSFTFALDVDPLEYERDDFLRVDVSVARDVLDGLQGETHRKGFYQDYSALLDIIHGGTDTQEDG